MRNILIFIAFIFGLVFIFLNFSEVEDILDTISRGDWRFLILAVIIQGVWMINVALSYHFVYQALELDERFNRILLLVGSAFFLNVVAPTGGMGGIAIFVSEARRKGYSSARVAIAGVLVVLLDYLAFIAVLILGLIVLFRRDNLDFVELAASGVLFFVAGVLTMLLYLGMRSANEMGRALAWLARLVNKVLYPFLHRQYLSEARAYSFAGDASQGLQRFRKQPKKIIIPILLSLSNKALLISILFIMFLAFNVPVSAGTIIGGFSIGYLFYIVSPTPAGIGFVEGALTLGLNSLTVPLGRATIIALAYRGITFWIPLLFGMITFRMFSQHDGLPAQVE
ncbi:MAG TPA: lysylphosphatidylglycerol synthase transmembrane domain-containing protein [Anaerolineales bacterium]|nr:lysylphosphatidylglycerol synthase transmembrane domain-containing protein [Anaerolineales bacterium]